MRRVRFAIDGRGPFEGMMTFGSIGDGEIEFVAIPARAGEFTVPRTVQVIPEDDDPFEALIIRITTDASRSDEAAGTMSGFMIFETV